MKRHAWLVLAVLILGGPCDLMTKIAADEPAYKLDIEILIQPLPQHRLKAQIWGRVFQQLGYSPRFRGPRAGEKLGMQNDDIAGTRLVRIVGGMTADGQIQIGGNRFTENDVTRLQEKLEELAQYGAGGPPSESPTFGLTDQQFTTVTALLSAPIDQPVRLMSPVTVVDDIGLPDRFRLTFTEAARSHAGRVSAGNSDVSADFGELSKGTALAISLAQFGLGFRPVSNPDGGYLIEIDRGGEDDNLWPVGWRTKDPINRALPEMFKTVDVSLEDADVATLTQVMADQMKIPHYFSSAELHDAGINITNLTYNRPQDRVSMAKLMRVVGDNFEMGLDVRVAENGKFFLWVTTRDEYLAFRSRFSHVLPGK